MPEPLSHICASARLKLLNLVYVRVSSEKKPTSPPDNVFHEVNIPVVRGRPEAYRDQEDRQRLAMSPPVALMCSSGKALLGR